MGHRGPVRLGVVGVGALAQRGILPHLACADVRDQVVVQAVCDPVRARARDVAERYGIPEVYASLEEMLRQDSVEMLTISSPIGLHYEQCRLAIESNRHVHVNKTMTTTVAEADVLIRLAEQHGVHLLPSPGEILRPQLTRTRQLIRSGAIGKVAWAICGAAFQSYHEQDEPERTASAKAPIDPSWYFKKPGGGPLYDMTVYALHQLTSVLGPARRVTALSGILITERTFLGHAIPTEADDNSILLLDFGEALFAVVYGTAAGDPNPQFGAGVFYGTQGVIDGVLLNGLPFEFDGIAETLSAPITDWDAQMRVLPHVRGQHRMIPEPHVFEDIMQLVELVADAKPTPVTAEQARHVIDIIESAYRAAAMGQTCELRTTFQLPD